jgi:hypothetical protein
MRIACLAQADPPMIGGAAMVLQALAQAITARGHEVLVLAASDRGSMYRTDMEQALPEARSAIPRGSADSIFHFGLRIR